MLYVEVLRIDVYHSIRDVKRLRALLLDYEFWSRAVPEYKDAWLATMEYCQTKISQLGN